MKREKLIITINDDDFFFFLLEELFEEGDRCTLYVSLSSR